MGPPGELFKQVFQPVAGGGTAETWQGPAGCPTRRPAAQYRR